MPEADPQPALSPKAARTRARILEAALSLFSERGFEGTTMRAVAERADVSVGSAYYYFASKEHLVQGYYERSHDEHMAVCGPRLEGVTDFKKRLLVVHESKLETIESYHAFAGKLFAVAADPKSPLSPFSADSEPTRRGAVELMEQVIAGSKLKLPADLAAELPQLLWLHLMSVVLFWVHDDSPDRARSYAMARRTTDIVARLVGLARNPLMAPLRKATLRLLADLKPAGGVAPLSSAGTPLGPPESAGSGPVD